MLRTIAEFTSAWECGSASTTKVVQAQGVGMKAPVLCVCLAAAAIGSAACASAGGGGAQTKLLVTTDPTGATLSVNGANMGPTPVALQVKPAEPSLALRLVLEGYQEARVIVTRRRAGKLEATLPIEGEPIDRTRGGSSSEALGAAAVAAVVTAVDRATGSAGRFDPPAVHVVLVKR